MRWRIAHGYAKATDRAMAVMLHANVGLMHGLLGIFNAWCDRLPVFVMGASGPADACRRRPWIEWIHASKDQGALLRHSVKWDDEPRSPQALVESMLRAAALMRTPPRGPVYVSLDVGLQELALEAEFELPRVERFAAPEAPRASAQAVERAANLLVAAERPVILMGRSSRSQRSWDQRVRLAEMLGARVATDLKSAAVFPTGHGLHLGGLTLRISPDATAAVKRSDVTLVLDWIDPASLFGAVDGGVSATIVNCTLDSYLHNGWSMDHFGFAPADLSVLADPEAFTADLLAAVEARLDGGPEVGRRTTGILGGAIGREQAGRCPDLAGGHRQGIACNQGRSPDYAGAGPNRLGRHRLSVLGSARLPRIRWRRRIEFGPRQHDWRRARVAWQRPNRCRNSR